jgi:hypothetical protein
MFPSRAVGYMRPPTSEEVVKYAARHHLHPTPEDLTELVSAVAASLEGYTRVEEVPRPRSG